MTCPLASIRALCLCPADAVRWACILEATAPKAGNVFPGREYRDLKYRDFVSAAEITAEVFARQPIPFSHAVESAAKQVAEECGTNVNLGILLLLGPIIEADSIHDQQRLGRDEFHQAVSSVLAKLTADDTFRLYAAINAAAPGGMGEQTEMDLREPAPDDFIAAMRLAKKRDRIAANYANGFDDLFDTVVPLIQSSIAESGDLLRGIQRAQLQILATSNDSLIERKFGTEIAERVQQHSRFDHGNQSQWTAFDEYLRLGHSGKILNPGTTADLIAAGLYVLLRESNH